MICFIFRSRPQFEFLKENNMKKILTVLISSLLILVLCACGAGSTAPADTAAAAVDFDAGQLKTMEDAFQFESKGHGFNDAYYVYLFEVGDAFYRATAELPADVSETLWAIDFFDETYDEQIRSAVAPLPIVRLENLNEMIPTQEELDALIGKNVQDLLDEGWTFSWWDMGPMEGGMYHGPFSYLLTFSGTVEDPKNFDESQAGSLTVKSVTYDGIGDATSDILNGDPGQDSQD